MAVVPDQLQEAPKGGLSQAALPAQVNTPINPTKAAMNAAIDEEEAPIDPIEKATRKMAVDREVLTAQIDKLSKSLSARQNLPFNPMYLEIARAAAKPASTGSAIEALGNIGGAYGDAYLKENQRQIDIEKDQVDLLKQKQALNQMGLEQELRINYFKDPSAKKMPAGPLPPVAGALGSAPSAPTTTGGTQTIESPPDLVEPNQMRRITANDIAMLQGVSPKLAEELRGLSKLQREAQVVSTEGIWDTMAGKWVVKFQSSIERPMRVIGNVKMTKDQSDKYDQLEASLQGKSEQEKNDAVANFAADAGLGGVRRANDGKITGFQGAAEKELSQEEAKQRMKDRVEADKVSSEKIFSDGKRAGATKQAAKVLYNLASDPETKGAFGVLKEPGVVNAFAVAVAQFLDRGSFGTAGLEDAVRTAGGTKKVIEAASYVASIQGQLQLMAAQDYLKGQGAVSDAERRLIANLVGSLSDTPQSVAMKAKVVEARADFDRYVADAFYEWRNKTGNSTRTVEDFYREKDGEYKILFKEYDDHMNALYSHYFGSSKQKSVAPTESKVVKPKPSAPETTQGQTPKTPRPVGPLEQRIRNSKAGT